MAIQRGYAPVLANSRMQAIGAAAGVVEAPPIVQMQQQMQQNACNLPEVRIDASQGYVAVPADVAAWLCWQFRGMNQCPKLGQITGNQLVTNEVTFPFDGSFDVGPDGSPDMALGRIFPYEWETEAIGLGMYRIKVDWIARVTAGALLVADVINAAQNLEFRILKLGTEDRHVVALNIGDAQDAARSTLSPADGGFWLPIGQEWVPYKPVTQTFDFTGTMPGVAGVDSYTLRAVIRTYFRQVGC